MRPRATESDIEVVTSRLGSVGVSFLRSDEVSELAAGANVCSFFIAWSEIGHHDVPDGRPNKLSQPDDQFWRKRFALLLSFWSFSLGLSESVVLFGRSSGL